MADTQTSSNWKLTPEDGEGGKKGGDTRPRGDGIHHLRSTLKEGGHIQRGVGGGGEGSVSFAMGSRNKYAHH